MSNYEPWRKRIGHSWATHSKASKSILTCLVGDLWKLSTGTMEPASCQAGPMEPGSKNLYPFGANNSQLGTEPNLLSITSENKELSFNSLRNKPKHYKPK